MHVLFDQVNSRTGAVTESLERLISLKCTMQIKQGDPREAASLASALLTSGQPLEVLHFGFQLLQAVVGPHMVTPDELPTLILSRMQISLVQPTG